MSKLETLAQYWRETGDEHNGDAPTPETGQERELSRREQGAQNRRETGKAIKHAASRFTELGGKLWGGLKRIGGAGLDYAFYAPTAAKHGAEKVGQGVEKTAAFVANAPDMALEKIGDGMLAGAEFADRTKEAGKRKAKEAKDWTSQRISDAGEWTADTYQGMQEFASEKVDDIKMRAAEAKQGFIDRKDAAKNWLQEKRAAWSEARRQKKLANLENWLALERAKSEQVQKSIEQQILELRGTANLQEELEQQTA